MPRPPRKLHRIRCSAPYHNHVTVSEHYGYRGQAEAHAVADYIAECMELAEAPSLPWREALAGHPMATTVFVPQWRDVVAEHLPS